MRAWQVGQVNFDLPVVSHLRDKASPRESCPDKDDIVCVQKSATKAECWRVADRVVIWSLRTYHYWAEETAQEHGHKVLREVVVDGVSHQYLEWEREMKSSQGIGH